MGKRLTINVQALGSGVTDLLNGAIASLSGPVGFALSQPRIHITGVSVIDTGDVGNTFALYKGASGASVSGTEVLVSGFGALQTTDFALDVTLESTDYLTGKTLSAVTDGKVLVSISAEIEF